MNRTDILLMANERVSGDRNATYGEPEDNFKVIAGYWSTYLGRNITPCDVGIMMALLKIGRISADSTHTDTYVDIAGYAACAGELDGKSET